MRIFKREFSMGDSVMLYNSRMPLFPGKLKSKWSGPLKVTEVLTNGIIEVDNQKGGRFKRNKQRLKRYYGKPTSVRVVDIMYVDKV